MRMTANERKELDEWVEKEYPKSEKRLEGSSPFHQLGKFLIGTGILSYVIFALSDISFLKPVAILFLILISNVLFQFLLGPLLKNGIFFLISLLSEASEKPIFFSNF